MNIEALDIAAKERGLMVLGGFHPTKADRCPEGTKTLILLGPDPADFWDILQASPQADDANPVDAWSRGVIGTWACDLGAKALFPFGSPPQPFISWAIRSGRCHSSPVTLLVHDSQGLIVSFRGALALKSHVDLPAPPPNPCLTCIDKPCLSACPVDALGGGYDTDACHKHLDTDGNTCMTKGCLARRACPLSPMRPDAQAAHHMGYFHR